MRAQRDRRPPRPRPWYASRDLAGLATVSVLAVLAIAVLIFIQNPAAAPAQTTAAPSALRLAADAPIRTPITAPPATGVTVTALRLGVRGGVGVVTGLTPGGTAVGRLDAGGADQAVRWDVSGRPGGESPRSVEPVDLPQSLAGSTEPTISQDGVIAYTATVRNQFTGRPVALVRGSQRTAAGVSSGAVIGANARGQVLLIQLDPPFADGTGFGGTGPAGTGFVWTPGTGTLQRVGEAAAMLLDDGSVLVRHPGIVAGQPRASLLWHDGTMTELPEPVGWTATVFGGSGWRAMAGTLIRGTNGVPQTDSSQAALWHYGRLELLPGLGGRAATGDAVNAAGVVAGAAEVPAGQPHAMRWISGHGTDLGTLGGERSWATSVSDSGLVTGWATTGTGVQHAAAWLPDGSIIDLGAALGAKTVSSAQGVAGDRVYGSRTGPGDVLQPVVWNVEGLTGR